MSNEWLVSGKNISRIRDPAPPVTFELRGCRAVLRKTRREVIPVGTGAVIPAAHGLPEDGPAALLIKDSFGSARKYFTYSSLFF